MLSVVFPINSTSNHNRAVNKLDVWRLYFLSILHQTTTAKELGLKNLSLYFLSILHQTTTDMPIGTKICCCISYQFYIKPQLLPDDFPSESVVFPINSTSNHNWASVGFLGQKVVFPINSTSNHNFRRISVVNILLYFLSILHQTTTAFASVLHCIWLYFLSILHQTTTHPFEDLLCSSCISYQFYIKPQPI